MSKIDITTFSNDKFLNNTFTHNICNSADAIQYGLIKSFDDSLAFNSKSPAYVLGEQLRNFVSKAIDISNPIFSKLSQAANTLDRLFSRAFTIFPGASAEETTKACDPVFKEDILPQEASKQPPLLNHTVSTFLNWKDRPLKLQHCIDDAFNDLAKTNLVEWGRFRGEGDMANHICRVNEYEVMKNIIQKSDDDRKDFYAIDIGSGKFGWVQGFVRYINSQEDLPKDITVHIIGVTGEQYDGEQVVTTERTKAYRLGGFKAEELEEKFQEWPLDLTNKVDIITSNWCFRHFADPVGTFVQAYNLLRPNSGILTTTDFVFSHPGNQDDKASIFDLFAQIKAPFIVQLQINDHFLVQKMDDAPLKLPLRYRDVTRGNVDRQLGSTCITSFDSIGTGLSPWRKSLQKVNSCFLTNNLDFYKKMIEKGTITIPLACV